MKKLLIGLLVILVLIGIGIGVLYSSLDEIVRQGIEEVGTRSTKTDVAVSKVVLDIPGGSASIVGLKVGNPDGYKTASAFELKGVAVQLDPSKQTGEIIHINSIAIDGPKVTYELISGKSNIDVIQQNVDAFAKSLGAGGEASSSSSGKETKLMIDSIVIKDTSVSVAADFLGGKEMGGTLPTITLSDIGKDSGGATPAEVANKIISAITGSTSSLISDLGVDKLAKGAMDAAAGAAAGVGDAAKGTADGVGKAVEGVGEGIKNMFGK